MTKRIFQSVAFTSMLAVVLVTLLTAFVMYGQYEARLNGELREAADVLCHVLSHAEDEAAYLTDFPSSRRITLIAPAGEVLYDSTAAPDAMDNHAGRPEVQDALEEGQGVSRRYSDTLAQVTYYYAARTPAGNVLRVSSSRRTVLGVFLQVLPLMLGILAAVALVSMALARATARRIVGPVNSLDLDAPLENDVYDELSPLLRRMEHQRLRIIEQMQALNEARDKLTVISEHMREGLVLMDAKGMVLSMNYSAATLFGADAQQSVGKSFLAVNRDQALWKAVRKAQEGSGAETLHQQGERYYRIMASPVTAGDRVAGVAVLALDVTEKQMAETLRREFTANVTHELKTPLTSISGYAEIIRDGLARQEDIELFASRICTESSRMIALINDILALSRLDERKGLGTAEKLDLCDAAQEAANRFAQAAKEKRIELRFEGRQVCVLGYAMLLDEMLGNLVDNAVKYTPEGGSVCVRVEPCGEKAVFSVTDTGAGIPPEHQEHVFERFYRVDKSHSRATGGTGLGLAIVKHGAQVHGAQVTLESEPGKGTRIALTFQREQESQK
ncbi:MAG: ATP-binding protein [Eubacteriales bacterium]|nr:ATP-binding protein [Eubacteriales bacterium]